MVMPRLTVSNYAEMLRKLSTSMLFVAAACVWLLRLKVPTIDNVLKNIDYITPDKIAMFASVKIPFGTFLPAFLCALISEVFKLHDRISDLFRIRKKFDLRWILIPSALLSGSRLSFSQFKKIKIERERLMGEVFYEFASSTSPKIDSHTIIQALTAWSWYWLCAETVVIIFLTAAIFSYFQFFFETVLLLCGVFLLFLLMQWLWRECSNYADSQIRQILSDSNRKRIVSRVFNAL